MLKSMTAYGRAEVSSSSGRVVVEISSVNRKVLEVTTSLSKELMRFDALIKKMASKGVRRGHLHVRLTVAVHESHLTTVVPNIALAKQLKQAWGELSHELGIQLTDESLLKVLSGGTSLFTYMDADESDEALANAIEEAMCLALAKLDQMKAREGHELQEEIYKRLTIIEGIAKEVEEAAQGAVQHYMEKITKRLGDLGVDLKESEDGWRREVAFFAERADITEELTRLAIHLREMKRLVSAKEEVGGKKMEFLIQEAQREMTTIAAKANAVTISHASVEMRSELEKIKEQIHNVE